jgi:large subunit ribosomal protein L10
MILEEMSSRYRSAESLIFVGYRGLTGGQLSEFRDELRKGGVHVKVVRNRITVRALKDLADPGKVADLFDGPTAIIDGGDPVQMAKVAIEFSRRDRKLEIKGGIVEGAVVNAREVEQLSKMPSRAEMLSIISGTLLGVGGRVAVAALAPGGRIAGGLKALAEKKGADAAGGPEPQAA